MGQPWTAISQQLDNVGSTNKFLVGLFSEKKAIPIIYRDHLRVASRGGDFTIEFTTSDDKHVGTISENKIH